MSTRNIAVGHWNEQGLLRVAITSLNDTDGTYVVNGCELTPEEARELERLLHERNAECD